MRVCEYVCVCVWGGGGGGGEEGVLLLKERICSEKEQILSIKSKPYDKGRNVRWSRFIANVFLTHVLKLRKERYAYEWHVCAEGHSWNGFADTVKTFAVNICDKDQFLYAMPQILLCIIIIVTV